MKEPLQIILCCDLLTLDIQVFVSITIFDNVLEYLSRSFARLLLLAFHLFDSPKSLNREIIFCAETHSFPIGSSIQQRTVRVYWKYLILLILYNSRKVLGIHLPSL